MPPAPTLHVITAPDHASISSHSGSINRLSSSDFGPSTPSPVSKPTTPRSEFSYGGSITQEWDFGFEDDDEPEDTEPGNRHVEKDLGHFGDQFLSIPHHQSPRSTNNRRGSLELNVFPNSPAGNNIGGLVTDLGWRIRNEYQQSQFLGKAFLPQPALHRIVNDSTVRQLMSHVFPDDSAEDLRQKLQMICGTRHEESRRRIFATLILVDEVQHIADFIKNGILDKDLPLRRPGKRTQIEKNPFYIKGDTDKGLPRTCFGHWKPSTLEAFCDQQYVVWAPVLKMPLGQVKYMEFDANIILPFVEYNLHSSGGFGRVWKVKIHPGHYECHRPKGYAQGDEYFCIKEIVSHNPKDYLKELHNLERFIPIREKNEHLSKLRFAFKHGQGCYLLFEWAEGDLTHLWKTFEAQPSLERARWLVDACLGIAIGLEKVHYHTSWEQMKPATGENGDREDIYSKFRGRHGDIKPENILWFKRDGKPHLLISDFGLTQFYSTQSISLESMRNINGYSKTYRPPEVDNKGKITQRYDMWCLGCLYLEFITWYLLGYSKTREENNDSFVDARLRNDESRWNYPEDKFFNMSEQQSDESVVKESVRSWIAKLRKHEHYSTFIEDFLHIIETRLLVPKPEDRSDIKVVRQDLRDLARNCKNDDDYCAARNAGTSADGSQAPVDMRHVRKFSEDQDTGKENLESVISIPEQRLPEALEKRLDQILVGTTDVDLLGGHSTTTPDRRANPRRSTTQDGQTPHMRWSETESTVYATQDPNDNAISPVELVQSVTTPWKLGSGQGAAAHISAPRSSMSMCMEQAEKPLDDNTQPNSNQSPASTMRSVGLPIRRGSVENTDLQERHSRIQSWKARHRSRFWPDEGASNWKFMYQ